MSEAEWLEIFSDNLRDLMNEQGYNQEQLSETTGLSQGTISNYLNKKRLPSVKALVNICYELNLSFDDLMDFGSRID